MIPFWLLLLEPAAPHAMHSHAACVPGSHGNLKGALRLTIWLTSRGGRLLTCAHLRSFATATPLLSLPCAQTCALPPSCRVSALRVRVAAIAAANKHTLALADGGAVFSWGGNGTGTARVRHLRQRSQCHAPHGGGNEGAVPSCLLRSCTGRHVQ